MVATFNVRLDTGGSAAAPGAQTNTDLLGPPNIRYKRADDPNINNNNPNIIPSTGTNFSRWKQTYIACTFAPDTQVDNVKIYTDGTGFGIGITVVIGNQTPAKTGATSTGYDPSDVDNESIINHSGITSDTDFFTFTSVSPFAIPISEVGGIINEIGETCDYVVTQMELLNTASPGDLPDETITYEYDEI